VLLIRDMTTDDVDRVSRIEEENFSMPWHRESFLQMIESDNALYVVAELDGEIVGTCGIITCLDEGDISNVVVDSAFRGRGIAYEMVGTAIKKAHDELYINNFTLEVRASNKAAISLYEKLGFVSEGIRPAFYEKPVEDAIIMWKRQDLENLC